MVTFEIVKLCLLLIVLLENKTASKWTKKQTWGNLGDILHSRRADDETANWPSPDQVVSFGKTIEGSIVLPGEGAEYYNATKMKNCIFDSAFGAVVFVETTSDVQKVLLFAGRHNLQPTILSSGSDDQGRSSGTHTLHISLTHMRGMEVNMDDPDSDTGMSITTEPGNSWRALYQEVNKYEAVMVGGGGAQVAVSGYTLGGGYSILSRQLGFGVDALLAVTLVTADGSIINVTKDGGTKQNVNGLVEDLNDPDLWWAICGGGGGVFGVVTSFKIKLHHPPNGGYVSFTSLYPVVHPTDGHIAAEVLEEVNKWLIGNATFKWGGSISINNEFPQGNPELGNGSLLFNFIHYGGWREVDDSIQVLIDIFPQWQVYRSISHYDTFLDYFGNPKDQKPKREYQISVLLQQEDFESESTLPEALEEIYELAGDYDFFCAGTLLGGATTVDRNTSVSPDLRSSLMTFFCLILWENETEDADNILTMKGMGDVLYQHGRGVYYNEADYFLKDWQMEFWADIDRYKRLLSVKQRWDPDGMFWCHHCVASEFF